MILLRDFALFVLPVLIAVGGWLYALSVRKQAGPGRQRESEGPSRRPDWRPRCGSPIFLQSAGRAEATMAKAAIMASDSLWQAIRGEAERAAAADPVFGKAVADAILAHDDFAAALADLIGRRLGGGAAERARFTVFSSEAFREETDLIAAAARDLQAIAIHDPAIADLLPPLLHFKGYVALQAWRVSNWLWRHDHRDAALLFQNEASNLLQVSIHPAASIGSSVYLDHATGIVIGANVIDR